MSTVRRARTVGEEGVTRCCLPSEAMRVSGIRKGRKTVAGEVRGPTDKVAEGDCQIKGCGKVGYWDGMCLDHDKFYRIRCSDIRCNRLLTDDATTKGTLCGYCRRGIHKNGRRRQDR